MELLQQVDGTQLRPRLLAHFGDSFGLATVGGDWVVHGAPPVPPTQSAWIGTHTAAYVLHVFLSPPQGSVDLRVWAESHFQPLDMRAVEMDGSGRVIPVGLPGSVGVGGFDMLIPYPVIWMDATTRFQWAPRTPGVHVHIMYTWTSLLNLSPQWYTFLGWNWEMTHHMDELP